MLAKQEVDGSNTNRYLIPQVFPYWPYYEQAGTGPSRRHIQGSKTAKGLAKGLENRKTKKNGPSGAPGPASASPWRAKRGTLPKLSTFLSQLKGDPLEKKQIFEKSHNAEKLKGGTLWEFLKHPICCKISKKLKGEVLLSEKNFTVPKKTERGLYMDFGVVCYAETQEKPFWFSSLGQMVQFGAIIFCRTFKNYFGQFVWIEKQAGTGPSRRHIQGSKIAIIFRKNYILKKMDRVARRGWRAERGTLPKLSTFLSQFKGFCRKTSKN